MEYTRVNWKDAPDTSTPLNAANLNRMDSAIAEIAGAVSAGGGIKYDPETDMIYIMDADGNWHEFVSGGLQKLYLYKDGDENEAVTGGWKTSTGLAQSFISWGYGAKAPTLTRDNTRLKIQQTSINGGVVMCTNKINLREYKTLHLEYSSSVTTPSGSLKNDVYFEVSDNMTYGHTPIKYAWIANTNTNNIAKTVSVDISDLVGDYDIGLCVASSSNSTLTLNITRVWLEK